MGLGLPFAACGLLLIPLVLACFALSPMLTSESRECFHRSARATGRHGQSGNFCAMSSNTTGEHSNTARRQRLALSHNTHRRPKQPRRNGSGMALHINTTGNSNTATGCSSARVTTRIGDCQHGQRRAMRSVATPPASTTRPMVMRRSFATPPAATTRPTVSTRSLATLPATTTRPSGFLALYQQHHWQLQHGQRRLCASLATPPAPYNTAIRSSNALYSATSPAAATLPLAYNALLSSNTGSNNVGLGFKPG